MYRHKLMKRSTRNVVNYTPPGKSRGLEHREMGEQKADEIEQEREGESKHAHDS